MKEVLGRTLLELMVSNFDMPRDMYPLLVLCVSWPLFEETPLFFVNLLASYGWLSVYFKVVDLAG
jgi:hypothetical protein